MSALHIHAPRPAIVRIVAHCYSCKRRRRHVAQVFDWYAPIVTCCACGLRRGVVRTRSKRRREQAAKQARAMWGSR